MKKNRFLSKLGVDDFPMSPYAPTPLLQKYAAVYIFSRVNNGN